MRWPFHRNRTCGPKPGQEIGISWSRLEMSRISDICKLKMEILFAAMMVENLIRDKFASQSSVNRGLCLAFRNWTRSRRKQCARRFFWLDSVLVFSFVRTSVQQMRDTKEVSRHYLWPDPAKSTLLSCDGRRTLCRPKKAPRFGLKGLIFLAFLIKPSATNFRRKM